MALPFGGADDSMLWQADSGFWFRLVGGYVSPTAPPQFASPHPVQQIAANDEPPKVTTEAIREFVRAKQVSAIVLDAADASIWQPVLNPIARPEKTGGVLIYRVSRAPEESARSCNSDPLAAVGH
jgi:hypothetical protein